MCMNSLASGQSLPAGLSYDGFGSCLICVCMCTWGFFTIGLYMMHDNTSLSRIHELAELVTVCLNKNFVDAWQLGPNL